MILLIDMGNTRIKWMLNQGGVSIASGFIATGSSLVQLDEVLSPYRSAIEHVFAASVLGEAADEDLVLWCRALLSLEVQFVRSQDFACGVHNAYEEPQLLGVDRWLALISSFNREHKACVVVSCGTAVTVYLITAAGIHLGGYIAPGLALMLTALNTKTRLITVGLHPQSLSLGPGRNTHSAVHNATAVMLVGLVKAALSELSRVNQSDDISVLISGGDGEKIIPFLPRAQYIPELVLDGLLSVALQTLK